MSSRGNAGRLCTGAVAAAETASVLNRSAKVVVWWREEQQEPLQITRGTHCPTADAAAWFSFNNVKIVQMWKLPELFFHSEQTLKMKPTWCWIVYITKYNVSFAFCIAFIYANVVFTVKLWFPSELLKHLQSWGKGMSTFFHRIMIWSLPSYKTI